MSRYEDRMNAAQNSLAMAKSVMAVMDDPYGSVLRESRTHGTIDLHAAVSALRGAALKLASIALSEIDDLKRERLGEAAEMHNDGR